MTRYYKIKESKQHYRGIKFFRFDDLKSHVVQVCAKKQENQKGRIHAVGVYKISRQTFISNYLRYSVEICTKQEFEDNYFKVVSCLISEID